MRRAHEIALCVALCAACQSTPQAPPESRIRGLEGASRVYTLTNLHPDQRYLSLSAANLQWAGLIPVCTEVEITYADPFELSFRVEKTGEVYGYYAHDATVEPLLESAAHYFGSACPRAQLDQLTPVEKEGVRLGIAKKGMRKEAVILACGYPPLRDTRSTALKAWRYWMTDTSYFTVEFDDQGVVQRVAY